MGRAAIPGPLGTETRQTMFAPEAVQPGISMLSEPAVWDSPTPLRDRLERADLSHLPDALTPPPPQAGTPVDGKRRLTMGEIALCEKIFRNAIDYTTVWVHREEFLPFGLQPDDCAMTPNGELYFNPGKFKEDFSKEPADQQWWFMHEMVHVWQHQLGYWVMLRGAFRIGLSYEYELKSGKKLGDYNMEAQGNLLADYFVVKHLKGDPNVVAMKQYVNSLALYEDVLSDFLKNPADHANLP